MLTAIPTEVNPSEGTNALIKKYFGPNLSVTYPAILFFQVNDNSVIDSLMIELQEEQIEPAFLELKKHIKKAVEALKRISKENRQNIQEIFNCLEQDLLNAQYIVKIKRVIKCSG